jgi:glycosyltransferase involved in cell wall biosynthesis
VARIALVHDTAGVAQVQAGILRDAGHEVEHIQLPNFGARWPWLAKAITLPVRIALYLPTILRLRRGGYDVIHIHWVPRGLVGMLSGRPYLIQAHGSDLHKHVNTPGLFTINRLVLERSRAILYVTPNLAEYVARFQDKLCYPRAPEEVRRVLIFMRLDPIKGVDRVFPAVERLARMVDLTALAWGPLTEDYRHRYKGLVRFVDPVPHDRVGELLQGFDFVIGQMEQGALGLSEIEAMAAGRPLISGIDRSLYLGDKPPVVFSGDADQLVEQVEALQHDSKRLANLSREGRAWVRRNHGYARHLELLEKAYFGAAAPSLRLPTAM